LLLKKKKAFAFSKGSLATINCGKPLRGKKKRNTQKNPSGAKEGEPFASFDNPHTKLLITHKLAPQLAQIQ